MFLILTGRNHLHIARFKFKREATENNKGYANKNKGNRPSNRVNKMNHCIMANVTQ